MNTLHVNFQVSAMRKLFVTHRAKDWVYMHLLMKLQNISSKVGLWAKATFEQSFALLVYGFMPGQLASGDKALATSRAQFFCLFSMLSHFMLAQLNFPIEFFVTDSA